MRLKAHPLNNNSTEKIITINTKLNWFTIKTEDKKNPETKIDMNLNRRRR